MSKIRLFHTSPEEIKEIHEEGLFGSQLFFSGNPYFMTQSEDPITYKMDVDENELLDINKLPYIDSDDYKKIKPIINEVEKVTGLSESESLDLLSERYSLTEFFNKLEDYYNFYHEQDKNSEEKSRKLKLYENLKNKDIGDIEWMIQKFSGEVAKKLGYKGAILTDEQGSSYLIDMLGRLGDLKKSNMDED